ncbi:MAG: membrane protein insertase YidC [Clostridia bacterium]|nr:membrane protein insertase YidC [Clostridia bacterium]
MQWLVDGINAIITVLYNFTQTIGFPSYALAIIILTILLKIVLYPLSVKQMKSAKNMQAIQPKVQEIQKKYKNNKEKMNKALVELYQQYDVNPAAGCLPILIQMPILIGLFQALRDYSFEPVEHAAFLWISNLQQPDPFYILPVLVGVATFVQSKITMAGSSTGANNSTNMMLLYFMPLFIGYISIKFPAGLCLYWVVFNVLSALQQYLINKKPLAVEKGEVGGK